jgi:hypothetical protein
MLGSGEVTTACLAKPRSATFLDENKHATPSALSLRTGHFSTVFPCTVLRGQMPLAFSAFDRVYPRVFEFFSVRQFFSHYFQPHTVRNSAGRSVTVYVSEDLMIRVREQSVCVSIPPCTVVYQKCSTIHTYQSPGLPMKSSSIADWGLQSVHTVSVSHPPLMQCVPVAKAIGTLS